MLLLLEHFRLAGLLLFKHLLASPNFSSCQKQGDLKYKIDYGEKENSLRLTISCNERVTCRSHLALLSRLPAAARTYEVAVVKEAVVVLGRVAFIFAHRRLR